MLLARTHSKFCILVTALSHLTFAQNSPFDFSRAERHLLAEMQARKIPGVALAIISGEEVILQKGFGVANVETGDPVKPDTLFQVNSVTKMFTAAALVTLLERETVDLNAPIAKHFPQLTPNLAQVTAHQLLSQTAGIKQGWPRNQRSGQAQPLLQAVNQIPNDHLFEKPGRVFSYSNPGYALAGSLIERISGQSYRNWVIANIFRPLGMSRTTYDRDIAITYPFSQGHNSRTGGQPQVVRPYPSTVPRDDPYAGIISSVQELSLFARAFINGGKLDGKQVLSASMIRKLSTAHTQFSGEGHYGYGLRVYKDRGLNIVEHGGTGPGFGSLLYMVPEQRVAIIILANSMGSGRLYDVTGIIVDTVLQPTPAPAKSSLQSLALTPQEIQSFAGRYSNNETIELFAKDGNLFYKASGNELPVRKIAEQTLQAGEPGAERPINLVLRMGASNKVDYLYSRMVAYKRIPD